MKGPVRQGIDRCRGAIKCWPGGRSSIQGLASLAPRRRQAARWREVRADPGNHTCDPLIKAKKDLKRKARNWRECEVLSEAGSSGCNGAPASSTARACRGGCSYLLQHSPDVGKVRTVLHNSSDERAEGRQHLNAMLITLTRLRGWAGAVDLTHPGCESARLHTSEVEHLLRGGERASGRRHLPPTHRFRAPDTELNSSCLRGIHPLYGLPD